MRGQLSWMWLASYIRTHYRWYGHPQGHVFPRGLEIRICVIIITSRARIYIYIYIYISPGGDCVLCKEYGCNLQDTFRLQLPWLINLASIVGDAGWWNNGRVSALHFVVARSISSSGDHGIHCWWDLISVTRRDLALIWKNKKKEKKKRKEKRKLTRRVLNSKWKVSRSRMGSAQNFRLR